MSEQQEPNLMDASQTVVDSGVLARLLGTEEPEMLVKLYLNFLETSAATLKEMDLARADENSSQIGELGHKLKSSARTIGANSLADCCSELEQAGEQSDMAAIDQQLLNITDIFKQVQTWVEAYQASNK